MKLNDYVMLGRSGLAVSSLCLGTMTFGTENGWGSDEKTAHEIFNRYIDGGGNFVDTADAYTGGTSEKFVGKFITHRKLRDKVVLATKFTFNAEDGNPNAGGNGRKNIYRALEGSLRRLGTEYIDLYWLHVWDTRTPAEEVLSTMNGLIAAGKIRYFGLSDVPAWYAARLQTLAEKEGKSRFVSLQLEYSLVERTIEREHVPAALELGAGICVWSPLAGGFLTGKYSHAKSDIRGEGRLQKVKGSGNPVFEKFTDRNWRILDELQDIARKTRKSAAQVALNWAATQPGISSAIIGATNLAQLDDNLASIEFTIPAEFRARLDEVSALEPAHPYMFFTPAIQTRVSGGVKVHPWKAA